jgi:hypothetical protein
MQVRLRFSRAFLTLFTSWSKLVIPEQRLFSNYIHLPMPEDHFGESVAARYDDSADEMFDAVVIDRTVAFLADLAGGGSALELGIDSEKHVWIWQKQVVD